MKNSKPLSVTPFAGMAIGLTAILLGGCGSGGTSAGTSATTTAAATTGRAKTGSATFTVKWPQRAAATSKSAAAKAKPTATKAATANTRYVPVEANSVSIVVTDTQGTVAGQAVITNPSTASPIGGLSSGTQTTQITGLAPGTYTVSANAEASTDGTGVSLSSSSASLTIVSGQDTPISLTLGSTVTSVAFAPSEPIAILGENVSFTAPAGYDSAGNLIESNSSVDYAYATIGYGSGFEGDDNYTGSQNSFIAYQAYAAKTGVQTVTATVEGGATGQASVTITEAATMSISPSEVTLPPNTSGTSEFTFSATAALNTTPTISKSVLAIWSIQEGGTGGSISEDEKLTGSSTSYAYGGMYFPSTTTGTYHIIAQNRYDNTFMATALVHITASGPTVTVTPSTPTVGVGSTSTFTAQVAQNSNQTVTWTVEEGASGGSITSGGVYTAPTTPGTYHIQALSAADSRGIGTATVTVNPIGTLQGTVQ